MSWTNEQRRNAYHKRFTALKIKMGGVCVLCGETDMVKLSIDHPDGKPYLSPNICSRTRIQIYEREWKEGKTRLLCLECNNKHKPPKKDEEAF